MNSNDSGDRLTFSLVDQSFQLFSKIALKMINHSRMYGSHERQAEFLLLLVIFFFLP